MLFEQELYRFFSPYPAVESQNRPRLSPTELTDIARARHPEFHVVGVWDRKVSTEVIAELWLESRTEIQQRLLDPYTGADLGDARPPVLRSLAVIRETHTSLMGGRQGRVINGIGAIVTIVLAFSGLANWLLATSKSADAMERFHRETGIWLASFVVVWGTTGAMLVVPSLFQNEMIDFAYALHSGAAGHWATRTVLAACALLIPILVAAGAWTWWRKSFAAHQFTGPPSVSSADDIDFPSERTMDRAAATKGSDLARNP